MSSSEPYKELLTSNQFGALYTDMKAAPVWKKFQTWRQL